MGEPAPALQQTQTEAFLNLFAFRDAFTWEGYDKDRKQKVRLAEVRESKTARPVVIPLTAELFNYPFVTINRHRYNAVNIDVDDVLPGEQYFLPGLDRSTYQGAGLPLPNLAVQTSGARVQAFWLLDRPLPRNASPSSWQYYTDVRARMNAALNGDFACNPRGAVRNPFYLGHKVVKFHEGRTELAKLNVPVKLDAKTYQYHSRDYYTGNRNRATFNFALQYYKERQGQITQEELLRQVQAFQNLADAPALPLQENKLIVRSIARNADKYKVRANRNYGAMNLPAVDWGSMTAQERQAEITARQRQGAAYTSKGKARSARQRLEWAVEDLQGQGEPLTYARIARAAGVALNTAKAHVQLATDGPKWKQGKI